MKTTKARIAPLQKYCPGKQSQVSVKEKVIIKIQTNAQMIEDSKNMRVKKNRENLFLDLT